jgi:hypothetical protein
MTTAPPSIDRLLTGVRERAERAGVFGGVEIRRGVLVCRARDSAAPASYRIGPDQGRLWVSLVMADRWLSESIEADLMHTGDKMEELIGEELAELGQPGEPPVVEHFRSEDLLFTFRSPLPVSHSAPDPSREAEVAAAWLLAYEAAFRNLGDMSAGVGAD